jgi:PAS domain S-box-containing protein
MTLGATAEEPSWLSAALDALPSTMLVLDAGGRILFANVHSERTFGYSRTELVGTDLGALLAPECQASLRNDLAGVLGVPLGQEPPPRRALFGLGKTIEPFPIELSLGALDAAAQPLAVAVIRDVSDERRAQELQSLAVLEGRKARERLEAILNFAPAFIVALSNQGTVDYVNRALPQKPMASVIGASWLDCIPAEWQTLMQEKLRVMANTESIQAFESVTSGSDGTPHWFESQLAPIRTDGEIVGAVLVSQEVTEKKRVQAEVDTLNRDLAKRTTDLEQHRRNIEELLASRTIANLEELVVSRTSALAEANEAARLAHRASEERLRIEAEARMQSRKMEAVGTLAAGVAHDFNNILGSIVGFAEMTIDHLPEDSTAKRNLEQILNAGFRARDLVARMLAFARESPSEPIAVDIVAQVADALTLLRASLRPSVQLSFRNGMQREIVPAYVLAEPTQIQQIVMNLCINAADAMDNYGVIHIAVDLARDVPGAPPERLDGICLTVTDAGSGMTPEVMERMFDPFFTTKGRDQGSGLGLSVVYGVVTSLGGVIDVQSRFEGSDTGTEFRMFLPLARNLPAIGRIHGAHTGD